MGDIEEESFKKVEKITDVISKLISSNDPEAIKNAESILSEENSKNINKTVINKNAYSEKSEKDIFMKMVEKDAADRAKRRKESREKADKIKNKANKYYKADDYEKSINLYTEAIGVAKDYDILYTNRAQAYMKLEKPEEAVNDCESAIFLSPNNHKAYLHKGKALVKLEKFDEAIECYEQVKTLRPDFLKYIKEYIDEAVELQNNLVKKEQSKTTFVTSCDTKDKTMNDVIEKLLNEEGKSLDYYIGGLEYVKMKIINSVENKNYLLDCFKQDNGMFDSNCQIYKWIKTIITKKQFQDSDWHFLSVWLSVICQLLESTTSDDMFLLNVFTKDIILSTIIFCCGKVGTSKEQLMPRHTFVHIVNLLYYLTKSKLVIQKMFEKLSMSKLITLLLQSIENGKDSCLVGLGCFRNIAESDRFKITLCKEDVTINKVIDCLRASFQSSLASNRISDLNSTISVAELLMENTKIRQKMMRHEKFLTVCLDIVEARCGLTSDEKHNEVVFNLLRFIHNIMVMSKTVVDQKSKSFALRLLNIATSLLSGDASSNQDIRNILFSILSLVITYLSGPELLNWCECTSDSSSSQSDSDLNQQPQQSSLVRTLSQRRRLSQFEQRHLERVCEPVKISLAILDAPQHPLLNKALKVLTLCSRVSPTVRFLCCDNRVRALRLADLIGKNEDTKQYDEGLVGNVCLLLSECCQDTPLAEHMAGSANWIMRQILTVCQDARQGDCRRNAAILAGRLAHANHTLQTELRRLDGFAIVAKFNNWVPTNSKGSGTMAGFSF